MIFKNSKIKLPAGDNLTFYAIDANSAYMYINNNSVKKKKLSFGKIFRCESVPFQANCDYVKQLSEDFVAMCFDGNISIIKNEG